MWRRPARQHSTRGPSTRHAKPAQRLHPALGGAPLRQQPGRRSAALLGHTDIERSEIEHGTYKNHFHCAPTAAALVPRHIPQSTAFDVQSATVVGLSDEPVVDSCWFPRKSGVGNKPNAFTHFSQLTALVGYLSYSSRYADLLFELIRRRHEHKSTLIITNKSFSEWGEVFPNAVCVVALVAPPGSPRRNCWHQEHLVPAQGGARTRQGTHDKAQTFKGNRTKPWQASSELRRGLPFTVDDTWTPDSVTRFLRF